ncbi:unnamed protein product [Vitrella brassicaformis CCMP3155]|uniref:Uncharacterized protein n=1 Tax=Vitrella brassicaformis (strain CCMP3155) TaxID=1169540 RepID=A0A0G4EPN1_VITBC|nr:unnamed protein product [Vitrella brassicaformis CCMP3155]|eukprot:CEL99220.1 unnamed protein product [Vitrella brassicaformis CCMP3155]
MALRLRNVADYKPLCHCLEGKRLLCKDDGDRKAPKPNEALVALLLIRLRQLLDQVEEKAIDLSSTCCVELSIGKALNLEAQGRKASQEGKWVSGEVRFKTAGALQDENRSCVNMPLVWRLLCGGSSLEQATALSTAAAPGFTGNEVNCPACAAFSVGLGNGVDSPMSRRLPKWLVNMTDELSKRTFRLELFLHRLRRTSAHGLIESSGDLPAMARKALHFVRLVSDGYGNEEHKCLDFGIRRHV